MAQNLARLGKITGQVRYLEYAEGVVSAFAAAVERTPTMSSQLLCAFDFMAGPVREVVVAGAREGDDTKALLAVLDEGFDPYLMVVLRPEEDPAAVNALVPGAEAKGMIDGKAAAYVCRDFACKMPVTDTDSLRSLLAE